MDVTFPRRKRGRPPKITKGSSMLDIEFSEMSQNDKTNMQIKLGYNVLEDILKFSKTKHLVEKPDDTLFGLHDYYTVIQKPLWFNEIARKFVDQEYKSLNEVISDIRLILENCYKFWGEKHKFSKQAFRIEKLLEKELTHISQNNKFLCNIEIDETNSEGESSFFVDELNSKILKGLEKKEKEEAILKSEMYKTRNEELQKWESEVLEIRNQHKHIVYMAELAEIGHFLALCHEVLCIKRISQYEIERMLLMPKESSTLATIMTALLCPSAMRGNLYCKPLMVYEVWSKLLSRKVDTWFNNFTKIGNKTQMFISYGIETSFWEEVGEVNPLINAEFSEISFMKRVWILKTLCTTIFQTYKKIEEYFNSVEDSVLRGSVVYEDGKFEYISLFQPEIRVYRICRSELDIDSKGEAIAIIPVHNGYTPNIQIQDENNSNIFKSLNKKNKFHLAAYDTESLNSLIKFCSQKKKSLSALKGLHAICADAEIKTMDALISMKTQWEKFKERSQITLNNSLRYWVEKEMSPPITSDESSFFNTSFRGEIESSSDTKNTDSSILGKRQLKKKFSLDELEISSDSSIDLNKAEEETSDWEEGNIKPKVPGRKKSRFVKWGETQIDDLFPLRGSTPIGKTSIPRTMNNLPLHKPIINPLFQEQFGTPLTPISNKSHDLEELNPLGITQTSGECDPLGESLLPTSASTPLPVYQVLDSLDSTPTTEINSSPLTSLNEANMTKLNPEGSLPPMPSFLNHSLYEKSPIYPSLPPYRPPLAVRRPYYRRARGARGPRMRYYPQLPPKKKLVRRPNIIASEIPSYEAGEAIKEMANDKVLTICVSRSESPPPQISIPPLPRLDLLENDLLLSDLQSIRLEPWLQGLD